MADEHERDDGVTNYGRDPGVVLSVLTDRTDAGATPCDIHEETGIPLCDVDAVLSRLADAGTVIRTDEDRWIVTDDQVDVLAAVAHSLAAVERRPDLYAAVKGWADDLPDIG